MNTITETLHALDEVKKAIAEAYASGYSNGRQRTWVGLTDDEIAEADYITMIREDHEVYSIDQGSVMDFARAIEAKLKEKNQ